jgi:GNAT superfamily N-acetyltransferase
MNDTNHTVSAVQEPELEQLLPLLRAYCDFYRVNPSDTRLLAQARALLGEPHREGVQLLARTDGAPVGFATVLWTWSTLAAARIGVLNDLYVAADARGTGVAEALVRACVNRCREQGAVRLSWQTAPDNDKAIAFYDRIGATRATWVEYTLPIAQATG